MSEPAEEPPLITPEIKSKNDPAVLVVGLLCLAAIIVIFAVYASGLA